MARTSIRNYRIKYRNKSGTVSETIQIGYSSDEALDSATDVLGIKLGDILSVTDITKSDD